MCKKKKLAKWFDITNSLRLWYYQQALMDFLVLPIATTQFLFHAQLLKSLYIQRKSLVTNNCILELCIYTRNDLKHRLPSIHLFFFRTCVKKSRLSVRKQSRTGWR